MNQKIIRGLAIIKRNEPLQDTYLSVYCIFPKWKLTDETYFGQQITSQNGVSTYNELSKAPQIQKLER